MRNERYDTPCDLQSIALGMSQSKSEAQKNIIKVGNGDVFCAQSAERMRAETNCDAVMVSRGSFGNPWVFSQIRGLRNTHPTFEEWLDVVLRHLDYQEEHFGNTSLAAVLMRKHLLWYAKGFPNCKALREELNRVESLDVARERLRAFEKTMSKNFVRYDAAPHEAFEFEEKPESTCG